MRYSTYKLSSQHLVGLKIGSISETHRISRKIPYFVWGECGGSRKAGAPTGTTRLHVARLARTYGIPDPRHFRTAGRLLRVDLTQPSLIMCTEKSSLHSTLTLHFMISNNRQNGVHCLVVSGSSLSSHVSREVTVGESPKKLARSCTTLNDGW